MKTTETAAIDSSLLQRNIAALIQRSKEQAMQDSIAAVEAFNAEIKRDSTIKELMYSLEEREALEADLPLIKPVEKKDTLTIKPVHKAKVAPKPLQTAAKPNIKKMQPVAKKAKPVSDPVKTKSKSSPVVKPKSEVKKKPQPKAVMQKRN
jgi:hypothetical protein